MANQPAGKASSDSPALEPYRGKPAVRNFRGGDGNVGIIRSPVRAIALPDSRGAGFEGSAAALLHATGRSCCGRRRRCHHQPKTLEQEHGALCRSTPYQLAPLALAVLHISVAARVLQAAVLENAVDEHAVIQDQM